MLLLIALGKGKKSREGKMLHRKADAKCLGGGEKEQRNISRQIARLSAAAAVAVHSVLSFPFSLHTHTVLNRFLPHFSTGRERPKNTTTTTTSSTAVLCFRWRCEIFSASEMCSSAHLTSTATLHHHHHHHHRRCTVNCLPPSCKMLWELIVSLLLTIEVRVSLCVWAHPAFGYCKAFWRRKKGEIEKQKKMRIDDNGQVG